MGFTKDQDRDSSWIDEENDGENSDNLAEDEKSEANGDQDQSLRGPANPFLKTRISLVDDSEQEDLRIDMFHFAWRVVKKGPSNRFSGTDK